MATDATTLLDRAKTNRKTIATAAGCLLAGVLLTKGCAGSSGAQDTAPVPQVLSGPTTTTTTVPAPRIDPLMNLGVLSPTAAALVGPEFDARRELARRASETMTNTGRDQCALLIGATVGGSWELSTTYGPAHPVVVFVGCPMPTTTTTAAPAAGS